MYIYIYIYVIKTMCPPGYHHNSFVATCELGDMMYGYTLLVLLCQRVLKKLSKKHNISVQSDPRHTECSQSDKIYIILILLL